MTVPSVQFAKSLKTLIGRLTGDKPDVDLERGSLTFQVAHGSPKVFVTFRIEVQDNPKYEVIYRLAPYRTQYSPVEDAHASAHTLIGAAQMVERALPSIESFLASWVEPT